MEIYLVTIKHNIYLSSFSYRVLANSKLGAVKVALVLAQSTPRMKLLQIEDNITFHSLNGMMESLEWSEMSVTVEKFDSKPFTDIDFVVHEN